MIGALSLAALGAAIVGCATFDNMRGDTQYGADHHLRNLVRDSLHNDPTYKFPDVTVTCMRGQIQLSGYVTQESQRHEAVKDAKSVSGVMGVTDSMVLSTNSPVVPESNP